MASGFYRFIKGVVVTPASADPSDNIEGSIFANSSSNTIKAYIEGAVRTVTTNDQTQTLTNKVLSGNTATNLISGSGTLTLNTSGTVTLPNATDTLVGKATTDVLTNKTLSGNTATNLVSGSGTLTLNTSGTVTLPNATDTLVGKNTTDVLTNKTLTLPVISSISNTGTLTLPNSTDTLVGKATTDVLTNKSISGSTNTFTNIPAATAITGQLPTANGGTGQDFSASTGVLKVAAGTATAATIVNADVSASAAIVDTKLATISTAGKVANSATTATDANTASAIVARDGSGNFTAGTITATLTGNATNVSGVVTETHGGTNQSTYTKGDLLYASAANTISKLAVGSAGKALKVDATGVPVWGTASGGGGVNYIANPDAETDTTGWATYSDAAGTTPVDGTGGSPTVTWTRSTSSPLRGTGSFLITKDAANRQGQGASYDFTIDSADQAKMLSINFDYSIASGTFVDNDLAVYIYDVTNTTLIQPAAYNILNSSLSQKFISTFQTASNSTSYRLIIHTASTSASAYTLKFDNINVGPQIVQYGVPVTDWVSYTPTTTAFGTPTITEAFWKREGDSILLRGRLTLGTTTGSTASISLPSSYTVDATKELSTAMHGVTTNQSSASVFTVVVAGGDNAISFGNISGPGGLSKQAGTTLGSSGQIISWTTTPIPITGWSSTVQMSNDADTRVVAASMGLSASQSVNSGSTTTIAFNQTDYDTHGAFNTSTNTYTVPISGVYTMAAFVNWTATFNASDIQLSLYKNGSFYKYIIRTGLNTDTGQNSLTGSLDVKCVAGDALLLKVTHNKGSAASVDTPSYWTMSRVSGPSAIAASETVNARYYSSSTGISGSLTTINYATKDFDSHSAYSAGTFTCPISGKYQINAGILITGTVALNNTLIVEAQKNGTVVSRFTEYFPATLTDGKGVLSDIISCNAGDTLRIQVSTSVTSPSIVSSNFDNYVSIARVGN